MERPLWATFLEPLPLRFCYYTLSFVAISLFRCTNRSPTRRTNSAMHTRNFTIHDTKQDLLN